MPERRTRADAVPPRGGLGPSLAELAEDEHVTSLEAGSLVGAGPGPQPVPVPRALPEPQAVVSPLTVAAIFLVVIVKPGEQAAAAVRGLCGDLSALLRAVGFRDLDGHLTCVMGFSADAWDRLAGLPRPAGLHPFRELRAGSRHAPATAGDVLFHIRAARMDLCFELATQIMTRVGDAVTVADEVHGFRYFDDRDVVGFVDGTENPTGAAAVTAAIIGDEDPAFAGGSYVIVQKYLHDMDGWNALTTEQQENIIGRTKLADIELDDSVKPTSAHNALTTIVIDGDEIDILRDNMPFGAVGTGEYGTYFIGYARSSATTELMLVNMFIGRPEGNYDRLLDFSFAQTGGLFFVPSVPLLESLADSGAPEEPESPDQPGTTDTDDEANPEPASLPQDRGGSLNIGSLRGESQDG
jgi:porphyrinogen peroxidase